jgi:UrcA family protein
MEDPAEMPMNKLPRTVAIASLITVVAALASLPLAAPVLASDITGRDVAVKYADLDVDTVDGATRLLQRIEAAADRVCAPLDHGDLASRRSRDACERKLTSNAVARVDSPALASVYQSARRDASRVIAQAK